MRFPKKVRYDSPKGSTPKGRDLTDDDTYRIYVEKYGMIRTGHELGHGDFGEDLDGQGWVPHSQEGSIAVSLAAEDCEAKSPMSGKKALLQRVRALLGP